MPRGESPPGSDDDFDPSQFGIKKSKTTSKKQGKTKAIPIVDKIEAGKTKVLPLVDKVAKPSKNEGTKAIPKVDMPRNSSVSNKNEPTKQMKKVDKPSSAMNESTKVMPKVDKEAERKREKEKRDKETCETEKREKERCEQEAERKRQNEKLDRERGHKEEREKAKKKQKEVERQREREREIEIERERQRGKERKEKEREMERQANSKIPYNNRDFALRQNKKMDNLPKQELLKQDEWVQQKLRATGVCIMGYIWLRVRGWGYRCEAGAHNFSDKELAEASDTPGGLRRLTMERFQKNMGDSRNGTMDPIYGSREWREAYCVNPENEKYRRLRGINPGFQQPGGGGIFNPRPGRGRGALGNSSGNYDGSDSYGWGDKSQN